MLWGDHGKVPLLDVAVVFDDVGVADDCAGCFVAGGVTTGAGLGAAATAAAAVARVRAAASASACSFF